VDGARQEVIDRVPPDKPLSDWRQGRPGDGLEVIKRHGFPVPLHTGHVITILPSPIFPVPSQFLQTLFFGAG
jgi:hypothetical protein